MSSAAGGVGAAVLGATGTVGQRFLERLWEHPTFEVRSLVGSDRGAGRPYRERSHWLMDAAMPDDLADRPVEDLATLRGRDDIDVVFSALPSSVAGPVETALADAGRHVFTNASDHRMDPYVPLLIPEVNPDHLALVERQDRPGSIVANGNCSAIVLSLALAPLHRAFGLQAVHVTTLQGLSGAGYPGVPALDVIDNVLPLIPGEEDKLETEPQKTLGTLDAPASFSTTATATRVPVREGHLEAVHARFEAPVTVADAEAAWRDFRGPDAVQALPSSPAAPIHVTDRPDGPQPRRDRDQEDGMAITVGRARNDPSGKWLQFIALGHNTVRGAAGQSILNAEYAHAEGLLARRS